MHGSLIGKKGISLERFQTLCLIAEYGGVVAASRGDPNRQSLFSRQIKELEQALGFELLDRSAVPHPLTHKGLLLEKIAREFIQSVEEIVAESAGRGAIVRLGAGESIIQWLLCPLLAQASPQRRIRFQFRNLTSKSVVEQLRSRRIDIGIVSTEDLPADLTTKSLGSYGIVAIGDPKLHASGKMAIKDLAGRPIAVLEGGGRIRRILDETARTTGWEPDIAFECTSHPQILELCTLAPVIGIVPEIASKTAKKKGLKVWHLVDLENEKVVLTLLWNPAQAQLRPAVDFLLSKLVGVG